jgi:hypothetical protein
VVILMLSNVLMKWVARTTCCPGAVGTRGFGNRVPMVRVLRIDPGFESLLSLRDPDLPSGLQM